MEYSINNTTISYQPIGKKSWGENKILLHNDEDLTTGTHWSDKGFTIEKFFSDNDFKIFSAGVRDLLINLWKDSGMPITENFQLDQYHTKTKSSNAHLAAIEKTKLIDVNLLPLGIKKIEARISEICKSLLEVKNPYDGQSVFHFRVIRPQSNDNNPLHRDVWLEDYKSCLNLYIPIAGSNELSSLIILPGSHHWPESKVERSKEGALINGVRFNVPAVTAIEGEYSVMRPDPKENEVLVFSPYLIHGGSVNLNPDKTRISIEMRLWKKN